MLRTDIEIEKKAAAEYDCAVKGIREPDLKELLTGIRDHGLSRVHVFNDLLKEQEKRDSES